MAPSNPPIPPPRTLNVKKFAESRSRELESLHSVISDRLNHDFKIHRSKRRRTTGYRSSKRRTRKTSVSDRGSNPKTSRRVRRRLELRSNPGSGFVMSGDGTKRLRTHLWHAKRFAMVKRWGFYLPLGVQGRGRGSRAVLKWLNSGALVHDASYCHPIQLEGPEEAILAILRMVLLPLPSSISDEISCLREYGARYSNAMFYNVSTSPPSFIAPVLYMWRPFSNENHCVSSGENNASINSCNLVRQGCSTSSRQLWIWIHPAAFEEGLDILRRACQMQIDESAVAVSCVSVEGHIAKLDIMGSKATQILQKVLLPVSESDQKSFFQHAEQLPSHSILSFTVGDPRYLPLKNTASNLETTIHESDLQEKDVLTSEPMLTGDSCNGEDDILAQWSKPDKDGVKHLWDYEKLDPPVPDNILCTDRHNKRLEHFYLDSTNDEKSATEVKDCCSQSCPIFLLKHANKGNLNSEWSIVLPLSWVKAFWISLVSHGAHAIGLRERRWIACDSGLPCFPYDFPDCNAYSSLMAAEAAEFDKSAELRPPAVRPAKIPIPPPWHSIESTCKFLGVQCPTSSSFVSDSKNPASTSSEQSDISFNGFIPRDSSSSSKYLRRGFCLVRVLLRAFKEGVFEDGAIVCAPILMDLRRWESRSGEDDTLQIPQSLIKSYFTQQDCGKWELQLPEDCSNLDSYRWPIGFVTTGFVRGSKKPTAVAFSEAKLLAQLGEQQSRESMQDVAARPEIKVWVRNLRSAAYRRAFATVILDQDEEDVEFM